MIQEPLNLHLLQNSFFRSAVERCVAEHSAHYGDRLAALYVCGSVHRKEAVPGVSDLDTWVFINDDYSAADADWEARAEGKLQGEIPGFKEMSRAVSVGDTSGESIQSAPSESTQLRLLSWYYRLRYDATLVWGSDLLQGLHVQPPDAVWARHHFRPICNLVRHAAGLEERTNYDFSLPDVPFLRLRKLARLGVLSGAYLLAAQSKFQSFKASEVLPPLKQQFPTRTQFLDATGEFAVNLQIATAAQVIGYLDELISWLDEVEHLLSKC